MALDDFYADSNPGIARLSIRNQALRPDPPTEPAFSVWGTVRGLVKGLPQAAAERAASLVEVVTGWSAVQGAYSSDSAGGMFSTQTDAERAQRERAREKLAKEGINFDTEASRTLRDVAHEYAADPATTHAAEQVAQGFTRFVGKAMTGGVGPLVVDEAMTTAADLERKGVTDAGTRAKAAVVGGLGAGAAMLPLVGSTIPRTLGLYAAGGPAGFVAQQAATRAILHNAGFDKQAQGYDPFDPLGLTLAALIPAPFAAAGVRGIRAKAKYEAETKALLDGHSDAADAARVQMLAEVAGNANRAYPADFKAQAVHSDAMDTALHQVVSAEPVRVEVTPDMTAKIEAELAPKLEPVLMRAAEERQKLADAEPARPEPTAAEREAMAVDGAMRRAPPAFDIGALIRDARGALAGGDIDAALQQLGDAGKLTPEMNNTLIAVSEFGNDPRKLAELLTNYVHEAGRAADGTPPMDVIANAVEATRRGDQPQGKADAAPSPFDQHAEKLKAELPDMVVEMPNGERTTLAQALDTIKAENDAANADANLAMVAAQCFLELGQ